MERMPPEDRRKPPDPPHPMAGGTTSRTSLALRVRLDTIPVPGSCRGARRAAGLGDAVDATRAEVRTGTTDADGRAWAGGTESDGVDLVRMLDAKDPSYKN